jgi:hypothetical protein
MIRPELIRGTHSKRWATISNTTNKFSLGVQQRTIRFRFATQTEALAKTVAPQRAPKGRFLLGFPAIAHDCEKLLLGSDCPVAAETFDEVALPDMPTGTANASSNDALKTGSAETLSAIGKRIVDRDGFCCGLPIVRGWFGVTTRSGSAHDQSGQLIGRPARSRPSHACQICGRCR